MNKKLLSIAILVYSNLLFAGTINKPVSSQHGFIENKGQIIDQNNNLNPSVLYLYNGNGLHVQLKQSGFSYELWKVASSSQPLAASKNTLPEANSLQPIADSIYIHRIDISFVGANQNAIITASQPASDYINYYTTGTSEQGVTNVHHYKKVLYQNIYPNIDVEFVLNDNKFKYNFIVKPGGNVNDIQLKFDGANNTSLTTDGHIIIETTYGNIDESIPFSYQLNANNNLQPISANFKYQQTNIYGLSIGTYNPTKNLIIDPAPWGTYYGGSGYDIGYGITNDSAGNILTTGITNSATAIATSGAYQTSFSGPTDVFILKVNPLGVRIWSTYYGGIGYDYGYSVTANTDIYITGMTSSTSSIATSGAYQTIINSGSNYEDAFIAKFNTSGARVWATYYGGGGSDLGQGIITDKFGNVLATGETTSTSAIATSGSYQSTFAGGSGYGDAFIVKFNFSGVRQWATYFGGSDEEKSLGITSDSSGNIAIVGTTRSSSAIATTGTYQFSLGGGDDAFIAKFNLSGALQWATYFGGSYTDNGQSITCDVGGNIFITGWTSSTSAIATSGAYQTIVGGGGDAFIAKFYSFGYLQWSTYYGGAGGEMGYGITTDVNSNVILTGYTTSTSGISTSGSFQTSLAGIGNAFITKFNSSGSRLWGTYYGAGSGFVGSYGIISDVNGNIFITGDTNDSISGIAASSAFQNTYGGGSSDVFIASFNSSGSLPVQQTSFDAKLVNNKEVLCTWQTASELNNDYFEIQRSVDGSQYTANGKVKGNGTSNMVNSYQFTDVSAQLDMTGTLYYRLKQVDFDGKSTLSDVRVVNLKQPNNDWNIYPNPTTNELHIETTGTEKLTAQVFDITGKQILENILFTSSSTINTSSLYEGLYFVRITNVDSAIVKTQKVAVTKR